MGGGGVLGVVGIAVAGVVIMIIYFIYKQVQFVVMSVNLYKKMVSRQDAMVKLLLDIRDNTKRYEGETGSSDVPPQEENTLCENCRAVVPSGAIKCPSCGAQFE